MSRQISNDEAFNGALNFALRQTFGKEEKSLIGQASKSESGWSKDNPDKFILRNAKGIQVSSSIHRRRIDIEIVGSSAILDPLESYFSALKKSFQFAGKTNRNNYWGFLLVDVLILSLLGLFCFISREGDNYGYSRDYSTFYFLLGLTYFYFFATAFTRTAIFVRRLRDTGRHWGFVLLLLLPFYGPILLFVWTIQPSINFKQVSAERIEGNLKDNQIEELKRIKNMLNDGLVSDDESQKMRKKVLGI